MKSKDIVVMAIFVALIAVMTALPYVFLIPLIVGSILLGRKKAFILSVVFGCVSLGYAFLAGTSFVGIVFYQNPWIPVVARLPLGVVCSLVFSALKNKLKDGAIPIAAAAASLLNTLLVCAFIVLAVDKSEVIADKTLYVFLPEVFLAGAIELVAVSALGLPLVKVTRRIIFGKSAGARTETTETAEKPENLEMPDSESSDIKPEDK